jgi:hypothetical protein
MRTFLPLCRTVLFVASCVAVGNTTCRGNVVPNEMLGVPCVPGDERRLDFAGYSGSEIAIETAAVCGAGVCLVHQFQGRTTCPYGQTLADATSQTAKSESQLCHVPGGSTSDERVRVAVAPQIVRRRAADVVHCSCRCAGADPNASYCACSSGFTCRELIDFVPGLDDRGVAGSYCVRETDRSTSGMDGPECTANPEIDPPGPCGPY